MQKQELELIKELRERTGCGVMDCKNALNKAVGNIEQAIDELRKAGLAKAEKRLAKEAKEGIIETYIHPGAKLGVLLEVNCETDFVAMTDEFKTLVHNLALQIAATAPIAVSRDKIPEEIMKREEEIYLAQSKELKKPANVVEQIVKSKMEKFYQDNVLMEQVFIKDPQTTINELVKKTMAKLGENIVVRRFARFRVGET